jgi:hypothetical protein
MYVVPQVHLSVYVLGQSTQCFGTCVRLERFTVLQYQYPISAGQFACNFQLSFLDWSLGLLSVYLHQTEVIGEH